MKQQNNIVVWILLLIFSSYAMAGKGGESSAETGARVAKFISQLLCDKGLVCADSKDQEVITSWRNCLVDKNSDAKTLMEEGNKLGLEKCLEHISGKCSSIQNDIMGKGNTENGGKYECLKDVGKDNVLGKCSPK